MVVQGIIARNVSLKNEKKKSHLPKVARHFDVFPCEEREKQLNQISESNE